MISAATAIVSGANIANTLNNFVRDIETAIEENGSFAGGFWDILDATAGLLVFGGVKPSLLVTGNVTEIWNVYSASNTPALARSSFYTRMKQRHDQIADDPEVVVSSNEELASKVEKTLEETVIEMIEETNTLFVTSQRWADYALLNSDQYPELISVIHKIIVGPIEPEDTTANPNVVPFNSINDVYQGYTYARTFTLQTEITTIGRATFSNMQSLEEIIVETEEYDADGNSNNRVHQYYSSVDGILFSKDGTILIAYPPNRKVSGVVATTYSIPNSVTTIAEDAFAGTKLSEIDIPESVNVIGARAFEHMHNLTQINVENPSKQITFNADTTHATDGVLLSASNFSNSTYSTSSANATLDQNAHNSFYDTLSALIVPQGQYIRLYDENDTQIGGDFDILFSGMLSSPPSDAIGLTATKMVISKNTQTFLFTENTWKSKFRNIADITLEASDQGVDPYFTIINGVLYDYAKTVAFKYPPRRSPGTNTELVLESTITRISACAFYDMRHITKITIPASVTVIGTSAFMHGRTDGKSYSSLTEVIFSSGSNLSTIQRHAFQSCKSINNAGFVMTLPRSVVTIEAWGFWGANTSITFEAGSKLNKIGYQSLQYAKIESRLPEGLKIIQQDGLDGAKHMIGGPLYIPASVEDLYPNSLKVKDSATGYGNISEIHFAKRSQVTGITLDNNQNLRTPFYSDTEIYVYGPLFDRLGWGVTNTWTQQSDGTTNWSSAWNLRGSTRVHHKYSYVVSFTMSTTTLVAGDSPTVNIQFSEPEVDFDRNLDITIFDTNTGSITSDLGTLSEMTTADGGTNWSGIFTPPVDTVNNGLELRLDNVYYRNTNNSDASVAFSMNTTRTPLTMYMLSKNLVKDDVAEIVIVFPDASSGTSFSMDRVSIYNSDVTSVLKNEYEGQVWTTSYTLTAAATADISYFGFVPNRVIYNTTIVEEQLTLTLVGDNSVSSEFNTIESYTDPGAIVTNSQGVQLHEYTSQVSAEVNRGILDTYDIIYNFPLTNSVTRTVTVVDTTQAYINNTTITSDNDFIDVTFSEAVYSTSSGSGTLGVSNFALSISGGVATISPTPTTVQANGNVYTLGISLSGIPDGTELVTVVPSTSVPIYDVVGNVSNSTDPNNNNTVLLNDKASPSMVISATNATSGDTVNHAVNLVFTVSEAITDFVASDIILVGGTISALNNSGIHYTTTFTPTSNAQGACSVSVLTGSFEDLEGRANIVDSVFSFTSDTTDIILYSSGSTIFTKAMWQTAGSPTSVELGTGWTEIGVEAFKQTNITSITIPTSVTSIGEGAFDLCITLTSITIPASVQIIGKEAFNYATNLTSVAFAAGSGLHTIGEGAFQRSGLTSITIPASVTTMGNVAFKNTSSLVSVMFAAGINLTYIPNNTFQSTGITSIEIPASVTDIGRYALSDNSNLTSVTFAAGSGLTKIQSSALRGTAITSIEIPASITNIEQAAFELCTSLTTVTFLPSANWNVGGNVHVGFNSFINASSLATVFIKDGQVFGSPGTTYNVNTTGAFFGSPATTTLRDINSHIPYTSGSTTFTSTVWGAAGAVGDVILGEGWTSIDQFESTSGLTSIAIPASVTSIGSFAFKSCTNLASVTFAANSGLLSIGYSAFLSTAITSIALPASLQTIGDAVFIGTGLTSIAIPASVTEIGIQAFKDVTSLANVTFAAGSVITTIGNSAFQSTGITSIIIPASVTSLGVAAFFSCSALASVSFAAGSVVGTIGSSTFTGTSITSIAIPSSVTTIVSQAFKNTSSLVSVTFAANSTLTTIGDNAFENTGLTSIEIPSSITSIGSQAFMNATSITSVIFRPSANWNTNGFYMDGTAFLGATSLATVFIKNGQKIGGGTYTVGTINGSFFSSSATTTFRDINSYIPYTSGSTTFTKAMWQAAPYNSPTNVTLGEGWTEIGFEAFAVSSLTSIAIPASVTSIGNDAFNLCTSLASVTFAAGSGLLTIGSRAFRESVLPSIIIPASVTDIGEHAFRSCASLASVSFAAGSVLDTIGSRAFQQTVITSIAIPASVTSIGDNAFRSCASLASVTFATDSGLTIIEQNTFQETGLTSITIPASVTSIGTYAFESCDSLASVSFAAGSVLETIGSYAFHVPIAFHETVLTSITIPASVTSIGEHAFWNCSALASVFFAAGSGLLTIGNDAFSRSGITSIIIPASVTTIALRAFNFCASLTSVTFAAGSGLLTIAEGAFGYAFELTSIVIPASVTEIGDQVFYYSNSLTNVTFIESTDGAAGITFGTEVFLNASALTTIFIKDGQKLDGTAYSTGSSYSLSGSSSVPFKSYEIAGSGVFELSDYTGADSPPYAVLTNTSTGWTSIGNSAFSGRAITSIVIPASVTSIGTYAFYQCSSLTSVIFDAGSQLTSIGGNAFQYTGLISIEIPASVTSIGTNSFGSCFSLASVTFAAGIQLAAIGEKAFQRAAFTSIEIPASVTSIGIDAFQYTALTSIEIPASVAEIGNYAFYQCSDLATVTFAAGSTLTTIGDGAFTLTAITSIIIPASVTTIVRYAFSECDSLATVTFAAGSTLATIGEHAFARNGFTSIVIPASVTEIGDEVFYHSASLTTVTFLPSADWNTTGITTMGINVFIGASALATIFIKDGQKFDGTPYNAGTTGAFFGSPATTTIDSIPGYIPYNSGSTTFTNAMWVAEGSHAEIELGEGWTSIGDNAFENTALTSIAIPASVTSIGNDAFKNVISLETVTFAAGSGLLTIGQNAFQSSGITSIDIPASVTSIGDNAFNAVTSLATVTFAAGSGLLTIGQNAFQSSGITSIDIPASVTSIGDDAFKDDTSLTTVTFLPSADWNTTGITTMGTNVFDNTTSLTTVNIKDGQVIAGTTYTVGTTGSFFGSPAATTSASIDDVPPTAAITYDSTSPYKNGDTVIITATFSESMDDTTIPKIIVTGSGIADLSATNMTRVTSTEYTYSYSVPIGNGSGVITLSTGTDLIGNLVTAVPTSGSSFTVDNAPPTAAITYDSTSPYKNGDTVIITATFSESMDGNTIPKIIVTGSGIADLSATNMTRVTSTEYTYSYSVPIGDGSGVITLSTGTDLTGNLITAVPTSGSSFTVDNTQPTLSSVLLVSDHTDITKAGIGSKITLTFTASEQIQTPTVAFNVDNTAVTGSINITSIGGNDWSAVYYVGVNHPSGALAYTIDCSDIAGNQGVQVIAGSGAVTVDVVRPTLSSVSIASNNSNTSLSKPGNDIVLTITASKTIQSPSVVFTCGSVAVSDTTPTIANTSGDTWTATYTTDIADTDGSVAFTVTYTDIYGNAASAVTIAVTDGSSVTFDKTLPTVSSFIMDDVALKIGETASVALTFSEAVPGFDSDSYVTVANGTMPTMTSNAENKVWTAVFTPTAALEDVTNVLTLISGYTDVAGNATTHAAIQSANYAIDTIQPVTASVTPITFNGTTNVINRKPSFVFSSTQGGTITTSNATFSTTTTAVSGNNTITFDRLADYTTHDAITIIVTDPAGNPSVALTVPSFTVDTTIETLDVITAVSSDTTLTDTLTSIGVDQTGKNVTIHATTNPYASYKARITLPNGDFAALTDANKVSIKGVIMELYATELDIVAADTLFVDLIEGSVIADVYVMTPEAVSSNIQICFPKGTPVTTNQGDFPIEELCPGVHTIRGRKITAITCTQPNTSHIVLIKKHALGKNVPCASTHISNHHRVFYKGKMVKAIDLVNMCEGVMKTPYNGETLYNVVMRKHDKMMINNLICETLHPDNVMARICAGDYTHREKVELCNMLKRIGKTSDYTAYNKFYASLK